eukprot:gene33655-45074_t
MTEDRVAGHSSESAVFNNVSIIISKIGYSRVLVADMQILASALLFGLGFIGQREVSVEGLGPMTCNALRFGISTILLVMLLPWLRKFGISYQSNINSSSVDELDHSEAMTSSFMAMPSIPGLSNDSSTGLKSLLEKYFHKEFLKVKKTVLYWGIVLGVINFAGSGFQQWGIATSSASKVGFIAGFDIFLTPIFALCVPSFKRNGKPNSSTWIAVTVSLLGLFMLSGSSMEDMEIGFGETLTIISTVFWTMHITYTDIACDLVDSLHMLTVQFFFVSLLSGCVALLTERSGIFLSQMVQFLPWMLFLAVSEGLAFMLMALGQNYSPPTHAAIILSLEGVFAAVFSFVFLGEQLTNRELVGCVLMLLATYIAKAGTGSLPLLSSFSLADCDSHTSAIAD